MSDEPIYPEHEAARMAEFVKSAKDGRRPPRPEEVPRMEPFPDEPPAEPDKAPIQDRREAGDSLSIRGVILHETAPVGYIVMTDGTRYVLPDAHRQEIVAWCLRGMQEAIGAKIKEIATMHGVKVQDVPPEASQNGQEAPGANQAVPEVKRKGRPPKPRPGV